MTTEDPSRTIPTTEDPSRTMAFSSASQSAIDEQTNEKTVHKVVEVYEVQTRNSLLSEWRPAKISWTDKEGVESLPRDKLAADAEYQWQGNWRLDMEQNSVGSRDEEGWEYATKPSRFGKGRGAHRVPREKGLKDFGRRRKWVRDIVQRVPNRLPMNASMERKLEQITSLLQGLNKAQREIQKMGEPVGSVHDSQELRKSIQENLSKLKIAQNEVRKQIEGLGERQTVNRGLRELEKLTVPFQAVEAILAEKMQMPLLEVGGAIKARQPVVSGGNGPFKGGLDGAAESANLNASSGKGAYVSREQQEQLMERKLRVVDSDVVDKEIMEERNQQILKIRDGQLELNKLFHDMASNVESQQEFVQKIKENAESADLKVKKGIDHLHEAKEYQKQTCIVA